MIVGQNIFRDVSAKLHSHTVDLFEFRIDIHSHAVSGDENQAEGGMMTFQILMTLLVMSFRSGHISR